MVLTRYQFAKSSPFPQTWQVRVQTAYLCVINVLIVRLATCAATHYLLSFPCFSQSLPALAAVRRPLSQPKLQLTQHVGTLCGEPAACSDHRAVLRARPGRATPRVPLALNTLSMDNSDVFLQVAAAMLTRSALVGAGTSVQDGATRQQCLCHQVRMGSFSLHTMPLLVVCSRYIAACVRSTQLAWPAS